MSDLQSIRKDVEALVKKFEQDKHHYLAKGYPEVQVRIDFLNPFFAALGWDIENKAHKPPHERDVIVEVSQETTLRPDYNFRINGSTKFFLEAKAPWVPLDDVNHIMQAITYAWSTKEVSFVILTDFEQFKIFDTSQNRIRNIRRKACCSTSRTPTFSLTRTSRNQQVFRKTMLQ